MEKKSSFSSAVNLVNLRRNHGLKLFFRTEAELKPQGGKGSDEFKALQKAAQSLRGKLSVAFSETDIGGFKAPSIQVGSYSLTFFRHRCNNIWFNLRFLVIHQMRDPSRFPATTPSWLAGSCWRASRLWTSTRGKNVSCTTALGCLLFMCSSTRRVHLQRRMRR